MQTKIFGKKIHNHYIIKNNQKEIHDEANYCSKWVFTAKPTIKKEVEIVYWSELLSFEGEPRYNKRTNSKTKSSNLFDLSNFAFNSKKINLSVDEEVCIDEEIFRADLNELHLHTDKIVEENDGDRDYQMNNYEMLVEDFNEQMILSNDKLNTYCKLHNLTPRCTDCIELFKVVFPDEEYVIEDGVMKIKEREKD
ncbi:MAG: hypothetical protein IJA10_11405 [Lachnospiraceae bacterium]|nr:hypothetical protein [Lachnospiraceae bacterium]